MRTCPVLTPAVSDAAALPFAACAACCCRNLAFWLVWFSSSANPQPPYPATTCLQPAGSAPPPLRSVSPACLVASVRWFLNIMRVSLLLRVPSHCYNVCRDNCLLLFCTVFIPTRSPPSTFAFPQLPYTYPRIVIARLTFLLCPTHHHYGYYFFLPL